MSGPEKGGLADLAFFRTYLRPYKWRLVLAVVLMSIGAAGAVLFPNATRIAVDRFIIPRRTAGLAGFIALAGGGMFLASLATTCRVRIMARVGQQAVRRVRLDLFAHLQRLPVTYSDRTPVGKIVTRLTSDVDALAELLSGAIVQMIGDLFILGGFILVMLIIDWRLALVTMAGLPLLLFAFTFLNSRIHKAEDQVREEASSVNAILQENVSGIRVIQAFWANGRFTGRFEAVNRGLLGAGLRAVKVFGFFWPIVDFSWVAGAGLILLIGGSWVIDGTLTLGTLAAFLGYSAQFFGPLHGLSQAFRVVQRALAGAVRVRQILAMETEDIRDLPPMPAIRGLVQFEGVTFAYQEERPILHRVSLTVRPGELVALVGRTGAGKTSLINLLCRFYSPRQGRILVDGHDIGLVDLDGYRRQIALVLQDPFLFSGTVRDNLRLGRPDAAEAEMESAMAAAGLLDNPAGQGITLDLVLTERGGNLSTGQRQLVSLARAILADPRIIILDEATAHVDTMTERRIQAAMARLLQGRTAFVIAHRLSTIQAADQILLIEEGRIVERGSHGELIAARGAYWRLCQEQNPLPAVD